ncbi:hypothetical protein [Streptococcus thoraltensis]|uniref:hypothetical protein n=1 Tax=Streptococcus thoraltensis TaxID=55085 RepID=UPI000360AFE8|nr:hypothetical protein [Streptococcus thoraltensis]MDY4762084.1 hypothetical protein [Streptococcus thoraltensis]
MKKFRYVALLLSLVFVLVACAKSPKEEFKSRLESMQGEKKAAYHYKIKVKDFQPGQNAASIQGIDDIVGKTLEAKLSQDLTKNAFAISVDLSNIDPKFSDFDLIYKGDKGYMSVQPMLAMNNVSTKEAEGKYVDIEEISGEKIPSFKEATKDSKADLSWLDKIDEKHFKKDGDDVSVSLTMNQLFKVYKSALKQLDDDKETAEQLETYLNLAKASLSDKSKATLTLGKDGDLKTRMSMIYAKGMDTFVKSIDIDVNAKKAAYKAPKLPKSSDILSQKELESLLMDNTKLSDQDFNEIYNNIKGELDNTSKESLEAFITESKPYLTDEQLKKLEDLANQAKG